MSAPNRTMVLVISLVRDAERRERFRSEARTSLEWDFFDAHTEMRGDLQYDARLAATRRGRLLAPAELGCYSSHYGTWCEFLKSDASQLIVLEDDTIVDWQFLELLAENDISETGITFLRLCALNLPSLKVKGRYLGRYVVHYMGYPQGGQGYVLTREGAQQLVAHCRIIAGPVDIVADQTWWGAPPSIGLFPCPVIERTGKSSIGRERFSGAVAMPREYRFRRQMVRIEEYFRLRAYRLLNAFGLGPRIDVDTRWM